MILMNKVYLLVRKLKSKILPELILSGFIFIVWLLINNDFTKLNVLGGFLLAILVPVFTSKLRPTKIKIKKYKLILVLLTKVVYDMLASNNKLIKAIFKKDDKRKSKFIRIFLEIRNPNALAVLATIICFTPGTAWAEISFDRSILVVHVFDLTTDTDTFVDMVKTRYEQPLMEIFE